MGSGSPISTAAPISSWRPRVKSVLLLAGHRTVVAAPLDELTAAANRNLYQGLAIAAAIVILGLLAALFMARLITHSR